MSSLAFSEKNRTSSIVAEVAWSDLTQMRTPAPVGILPSIVFSTMMLVAANKVSFGTSFGTVI